MLYKTKELQGRQLIAFDGAIGHVKDFYFDDRTWVIRYVVADTGSWLPGRLVLITPHAFGPLDRLEKILPVNLTRTQIENSPPIDVHQPVSRQYEAAYYCHYGWPPYWEGSAVWGVGAYPVVISPSRVQMLAQDRHHHRNEKHLQSANAIEGYEIEVLDGVYGAVSGLLVDDNSWAIREIVAGIGHWYSGREILIAPENVVRISYEESKVFVSLTIADLERTAQNKVAHAGAREIDDVSFSTD